jgi:hypothetical protein
LKKSEIQLHGGYTEVKNLGSIEAHTATNLRGVGSWAL